MGEVPSNATQAAGQQIGTSLEMVREITRDLRQFVLMMEPPKSDPGAFEEEIREWLQRVGRAVGAEIAVRIQSGFAEQTGAETLRECSAVAGECVCNAIRHGHAGRIHVSLEHVADRTVLNVEDDGIGFSPEDVPGGNGLRNLRTRAAHLGGEFTIESSPGGPTVARMVLPRRESGNGTRT